MAAQAVDPWALCNAAFAAAGQTYLIGAGMALDNTTDTPQGNKLLRERIETLRDDYRTACLHANDLLAKCATKAMREVVAKRAKAVQ